MNTIYNSHNTIKSLHKATIALTKRVPVDILLQLILDSARELIGSRYAAIGIFNEKNVITQFVTSGLDTPHKMPLPTGDSLLGHIYKQNKTIRIDNLSTNGYMQEMPPDHPIMSSFLGLPIIAEGIPVGSLYLTDKIDADGKIVPFSAEEAELIEMFAAHAGVAWQNARLYQTMNHMVDHYYQKAVTDGLTGLFNRRRFDELMQQEIDRAHRYQRPLSLVMIDIDYFKQINDTYGHMVGDEILRHLSRLMLQSIRQFDTVCRFGGEEFTIMLPESRLDGALLFAERLRAKIETTPIFHEGNYIQVTASLGVVELQENMGFKNMLSAADSAMYQAKNKGRNQVCAFLPKH